LLTEEVRFKMSDAYILGAGLTGLSAGMTSGCPVLEALDHPGGICASYYKDGYRFEIGGGHWIFGGDTVLTSLITKLSPCRHYIRNSGVFFTGGQPNTAPMALRFVPYPIQNNLWALDAHLRAQALEELVTGQSDSVNISAHVTMAEWLLQRFGNTLYDLFFGPFHERYTAGLLHEIAPQDLYKSPVDLTQVVRGAFEACTDAGYNLMFLYPLDGLDALAESMAQRADVRHGKKVAGIDLASKQLIMKDSSILPYTYVVSTLPLNRMMEISGEPGQGDPFTSALVVNIAASLPQTPIANHGYHWLYVPDSSSGFHRIGYYSNVDVSFLSATLRDNSKHASIYVETAYRGGAKPAAMEIERVCNSIVQELATLGLIDTVQVIDATWIDVAYTWQRPRSAWRERAIQRLAESGVFQAGRYGRWTFQGIAKSIREGLAVGGLLKELVR